MISFLVGEILAKRDNYLLVLTQAGIGYKVYGTQNLSNSINVGDKINIFTYLQVREDSWSLFGFKVDEDLSIFEKLISISGVGPKAALAIMSNLGRENLIDVIAKGLPERIATTPGIGKKTAERIVLELSGKLCFAGDSKINKDEAFCALESLGYSSKEIAPLFSNIDPSLSTEQKIKLALRELKR
jgi:Holliday junction DNA helicase RuvA